MVVLIPFLPRHAPFTAVRSRRVLRLGGLCLGLCLGLLLAPAGLPPAVLAQGHHGDHGAAAPSPAPAAPQPADTLLALAQMQGHLLMAQELIAAGAFRAAEPHVGHPVDELYGSVAPALAQRGLRPFLATLEDLRQLVRLRPTAPETISTLQLAQQRIEAAAAALSTDPDPAPALARASATSAAPAAGPQAARLQALVRELAQSAVEEYSSALAGDQVVEVIDYQDARGFLRQGLWIARQHREEAASWAAMEGTLTQMLEAFPSATPPERAVLSLAELQARQRQL